MNVRSHRLSPFLTWSAVPLFLGSALAFAPWTRPAARAQDDLVVATGIVDAWRMEDDGMLYVRIARLGEVPDPVPTEQEYEAKAGQVRDPEGYAVWFRTPADQTDATYFEDLFLEVILHTRSQESTRARTLTVVGKDDPDEDGQTWAEAYAISAVSQP